MILLTNIFFNKKLLCIKYCRACFIEQGRKENDREKRERREREGERDRKKGRRRDIEREGEIREKGPRKISKIEK